MDKTKYRVHTMLNDGVIGFMRRLAVTLFTVCLFVGSVSCSWDFSMHKDSSYIGDIQLNKKVPYDRGGDHIVYKRSIKEDDWLPSHLELSIGIHGDEVTLRLVKNVEEDTTAPVYIVHDGKIRLVSPTKSSNYDYALYQDINNGASLLVKHRPTSIGYDVTGTYVHDGEEYSIQPIRGETSSDVDHKIARINLNEAELIHDVIDFGSSEVTPTDTDSNTANVTEESIENDSASTEYLSNTTRFEPSSSKIRPAVRGSDKTRNSYSQTEYPGNEEKTSTENNTSIDISDNIRSAHVENDTDSKPDGLEGPQLTEKQSDEGSASNEKNDDEDDDGDEGVKERKKRQAASKYVVEMLIVVDYGVYEVWHNGVQDLEGDAKKEEALKRIKQYYSFVINGVDLRYKSVTKHAPFSIDVTWAGIVIFDNPVPDYWKDTEKPPTSSRDFVESSAALEAFRAWADGQGTELPASDHVMLFTGHNLTYGGSVSNAGLAYLGSACNPDYFYSIVEEYFEFRDVAIAAHELGHSLGARHDMDGNTCLSFDRYIMTSRFKFPSSRKAKNPWLFSSCSVEYFTDFIDGLDRNDTNCLIVKDATSENENSQPFVMALPGEVYIGDDFCKIGEGPDSYICRDQHISSYNNICYGGLYCHRPSEQKCIGKLPPNGMPCGNKKWCLNGTCVESEMAPASSDECPFGDEPGLIGGKTCAQRMLTSRYDCYRDTFRGKCCASCRRYRRNLPGCEYGDMFELCKKEQCTNYDEEYARENCCNTCAELFYTIPTTVFTTPTTTTTTSTTIAAQTTTAAYFTGSSNGGGKGNGKGSGKGGPTEEKRGKGKKKGGDEKREEEDGGKSERNKKDVSLRRRNRIDSEESDESGYRRRSYNRRRGNTGYRVRNQRRLNALTNDRLIQIRTLLGAMKRARDDSRLQRMRFLMYILDKSGYDNVDDNKVNGNPPHSISKPSNEDKNKRVFIDPAREPARVAVNPYSRFDDKNSFTDTRDRINS